MSVLSSFSFLTYSVITHQCMGHRYKLSLLQQPQHTKYHWTEPDLFHSMEVIFSEYFQSISRIFVYYGRGPILSSVVINNKARPQAPQIPLYLFKETTEIWC